MEGRRGVLKVKKPSVPETDRRSLETRVTDFTTDYTPYVRYLKTPYLLSYLEDNKEVVCWIISKY